MSGNVGYIPNEIAIFHRDNDQQNHWVQWGTQHFQTNPVDIKGFLLSLATAIVSLKRMESISSTLNHLAASDCIYFPPIPQPPKPGPFQNSAVSLTLIVVASTAQRGPNSFLPKRQSVTELWVTSRFLFQSWLQKWVCLKIVYPYTQWFCWSLSLLNGYFIGNIPYLIFTANSRHQADGPMTFDPGPHGFPGNHPPRGWSSSSMGFTVSGSSPSFASAA